MQALYLAEKRLTFRSDYPQPVPKNGEALIRVVLAGICSTDLEMVKGYYPFTGVLGHEFVGVVESCPSERSWEGRRVVGSINVSPDCDGSCSLRCPEQCPQRVTLGIVNKDGVFADYITLPTQNLLEVPHSVTDEQAVFTEPLAAAVRVTEQVDVVGKQVAVIGPGRLGILVAQVVRQVGADVTVIGRSQRSLQLARDLHFTILDSDAPSINPYDAVIEATGNPAGFKLAVDIVKPNGTIVLKSTYADADGFQNIAGLLAQVVVNEITLVGSRCGPFAPALQLLAADAIQTAPLIEATYALTDGLAAFEHAARKGVYKVLLRP